MDKQTKIIMGLLVTIIILGIMFTLKATGIIGEFKISSDSNKIETVTTNNTNMLENITNGTVEDIKNTKSVQSYSVFNKDFVFNIIDIVVILLIVPMSLKKYNLTTNVIGLTLYKFIAVLLLNTAAINWTIAIFLLVFILIYSYIFLAIVNKFLLDINPIFFVIGVIVVESIVYYITIFILGFIVGRFLL